MAVCGRNFRAIWRLAMIYTLKSVGYLYSLCPFFSCEGLKPLTICVFLFPHFYVDPCSEATGSHFNYLMT